MGIGDVAKMGKQLYKARQAQKQMSKIKAAGQAGFLAILINGTNEVTDAEVNRKALAEELLEFQLDEKLIEKLAKKVEEYVKKAANSAKKNLEKEMMNSANLEELRGMLGI